MLKTIFDTDTCANCRNCCVFEEQSTWELPTFSADTAARLNGYVLTRIGNRVRVTLPCDETHTAKPCPFLDPESGCTLPPEEKPFACSIWPLRVMRTETGETILALYRGCPGLPEEKIPALKALLDSGLRDRIYQEAAADPSLILPYHENYIPLDTNIL